MIYVFILIILLAMLFIPQAWVRSVKRRYDKPRSDIKGTGFEFAKHLLNRLDFPDNFTVEAIEGGDHYDPVTKTVRLSTTSCHKKSLSSVVIAAHEVGHALQDKQHHRLFTQRIWMVRMSSWVQIIAPFALGVAPLLLLLTKSPVLSFVVFIIGFLSIAMNALIHFITLPVELDASFNKAMPILIQGRYFEKDKDYRAAKKLLWAAALTYVAQSLFNLLNIAYWIRLLKR